MPYAYRKSERIRKNKEFVSVMKGKRLSVDGLSLFYTRNSTGNFRIGLSVSKKQANAVTRNRLKRRMRACLMKLLQGHSYGYDLVFVARRELYGAGSEQVQKTIETVLNRSALLRSSKPKSKGTSRDSQ